MVFFPVNLSGSGQPKVAGREQVGRSVITLPGKIAQPVAGLDSLRFASAALAGNVQAVEKLLKDSIF
ncbi:hypothetical protein [Microbulbifer sp. JTAC008]|uniref:hypothetical protein n=1 Tax=Microbulbifer sp. JTAC008 TaxID=3243374 RepID=UPI0040392A96